MTCTSTHHFYTLIYSSAKLEPWHHSCHIEDAIVLARTDACPHLHIYGAWTKRAMLISSARHWRSNEDCGSNLGCACLLDEREIAV